MGNPISAGSFSIERPARFLFRPAAAPDGPPINVIALHGYGMSAAAMAGLTGELLGPSAAIAALEAPNAFNIGRDPRSTATGYNWGTRETADFHIQVHHRMIDGLLRILQWDPARVLLLGYSQSVGLNYRYLAANPTSLRAAAGLCGGIPANWGEAGGSPITTSLLHVARSNDEFFPAADIAQFEQRLRRRATDVEFHLLPGRHRFPLTAAPLVRAWLQRIFPDYLPPEATA